MFSQSLILLFFSFFLNIFSLLLFSINMCLFIVVVVVVVVVTVVVFIFLYSVVCMG